MSLGDAIVASRSSGGTDSRAGLRFHNFSHITAPLRRVAQFQHTIHAMAAVLRPVDLPTVQEYYPRP